MKKLRIGTRTSALAMAQATLVKASLLKTYPDLNVELVGLQTQGDVDRGTVEHADFVGDLHEAVMNGNVDCAIHSFKDIHQTQATALGTVVLTARDNPRDVAVFRSDIMDVLRIGKTITLGCSTVLRAYNVPSFLKDALPALNKEDIQIDTRLLRGTVEDRLQQLDEGTYDGIVLAVAGLNRLHDDPRTKRLLSHKKIMILPLTDCPTAPGQGVMAIECRDDDNATIDIISVLKDQTSSDHVLRELQTVRPLGDCMGATSIATRHFSDHIVFAKGIDQNDNDIKTVLWPSADNKAIEGATWDGTQIRSQAANTDYLPINTDMLTAPAVFVTHSRAVHPDLIQPLKTKTVWTSGTQSWFRLARQGLWVQGCTEELGHDILQQRLSFLDLPAFGAWQVLTHDQTNNDWQSSQIVATYSVKNTFDADAAAKIKNAQHIFWSSTSQYHLYKDHVANDSAHYCRAGKTAEALKSYNLSPLTVFPNSEMWRQCLTKRS